MTLEKRAPTPVAGSRSFLTAIRQLLTFSSPNPMEHEDEQKLRQQIISVAVSESQQDGIFRKDGSVIVTFSQSPHDVTAYVKEKSPYPDDTSGGFSDVYKCVLEKPGEPSAVVSHISSIQN
ncbi:hypothetical protein PAXINDRAFT_17457 [Paxillus involutus ATCC 200175]|uniref:Uncharacterized protein n=1 Tax=Paxillus involutus ATCC 200175 TaxID=664439 RepID=A0A0C9TQJ7_PAXIN|nr:hypothetical protein PAXINDRAFT_17457 [Paxillus involutus ATCC 200175]